MEAIQRAAECFGGKARLARALGVTPPVVQEWARGERAVPILRCVQIERATAGAVTRRDLRPLDWQEIWPELAVEAT